MTALSDGFTSVSFFFLNGIPDGEYVLTAGGLAMAVNALVHTCSTVAAVCTALRAKKKKSRSRRVYDDNADLQYTV